MKMSQWIILTALVAASVIHSAHSGCSPWDWIKCAAVVTACAAECADTGGAACIACLGPSYDQCKDCIGHQDNINALASLQGAQAEMCSAWDWVECSSKLYECDVACGDNLAAQPCSSCVGKSYSKCIHCNLTQAALGQLSGCSIWDKIQCAAVVAQCAATCGSKGITSQECISCFGSSYDQCKGCLGLGTAVQSINFLQGCSTLSWLRCAGSLTTCAAECIDNGFDSPQCFHCLGSNYNPCIKCIPSKDMEDIKQLASTQHAARACGGPKGTCDHEL